MESLVYSARPSYDNSDPSHVQSHSKSSLLRHSTPSLSSLRPVPPSPVLSHSSLFQRSALNPPLTLPPLPYGQHSYHQDELVRFPDMNCDILRPSELPLSSPAALPSILHLPIDFNARSIPPTPSPPEKPSLLNDDPSFLDPSPSAQHHPTSSHHPSLFPADSWLDVVPMPLAESDPFRWENGIKHPQPLCHEPLRSVWSPESPSPIEELDEMDFDPSTPSSSRSSTISPQWSLESLPDDQQDSDSSPRWADDDGSWMTSPDHQDDGPLPFSPVPPSFSRPAYDCKVPHNHDWDDRGYLPPASFSPEDGEELLRPPSSPRSPLVNFPDLPLQHCEDFDDDYDTSALLCTPNRRTSLPELEDDFGHISPSSTTPNLPGPGTDNTVKDFHRDLLEIDLTSPPLPTCPTPPNLYDGPALGLYMADEFSNAAQSPSPEYTHVDDLFTYFPELEKYDILNTDDTAEDLGPLHPDYHPARFIRLCRWRCDAEKTARAREIGDNVKAIIASTCRREEGDVNVGPCAGPNVPTVYWSRSASHLTYRGTDMEPVFPRIIPLFPSYLAVPLSVSTILMGRKPWADEHQTAFLESYLPGLDTSGEGQTLCGQYDSIAIEFLKKWPVTTQNSDQPVDAHAQEGQVKEEQKRKKQIHQWFQNRRKTIAKSPRPKQVIDLSAKPARKTSEYQQHHAYSVRYYRPEGSALRKEVDDLWNRRNQKAVLDLLTPFANDRPLKTRLDFHNATMAWKCSLLTKDEAEELKEWNENVTLERQEKLLKPWVSGDCDNDLAAENEFIQSRIDALPLTMSRALARVEETTGMKAIILIGGPSPAENGDINTHIYQTGKSKDTGLSFSEYFEGMEDLHDQWVNWLRSVYAEEEIARRRRKSPATSRRVTPTQTNPLASAGEGTLTPIVSSPRLPSPPELSRVTEQPRNRSPGHPISNLGQTPPEQPLSLSTLRDESHSLPPPATTTLSPHIGPNDNERDFTSTTPPSPPHTPGNLSSPTVASVNAPDPSGDVAGLPTANAGRVPCSPGSFASNGIPFVTEAALSYLRTIPAGEKWADMITSYLFLEALPTVDGTVSRLSTKSRPVEVSNWMKPRSYETRHIPFISDIGAYSEKWIDWWTSCQPSWRQSEDWPLPREGPGPVNWPIRTCARGKSGLFLVVMSTTWWACSIQSEDDWGKFDEAVDDLHWVIGKAIASYETLSPPPSLPPPTCQDPEAPNAAGTFRREGKREVRVPGRFR